MIIFKKHHWGRQKCFFRDFLLRTVLWLAALMLYRTYDVFHADDAEPKHQVWTEYEDKFVTNLANLDRLEYVENKCFHFS